MAYVGVRPVDVIDLSKSDALNVTTSATIGGELTVDTNTLKVDSTNNRVGIGVAAPDSTLHIAVTAPVIQFTDTNTNADSFLDANSGNGSFTIAVDENNEVISSKLNIRVDGTAIMTVDNSTVGIGVTNADAMLHMKSSNNPKILMTDVTTANSAELECDGGALTINSVSATKFEIGGSEISRITAAGLGIGTTSPSGLIHVQAVSGTDATLYLQTSATTDDSVIHFGDNGNASAGKILYDHDDNAMTFVRNGEAMRIASTNTIFIGRTSGTPSSSEFGMKLTGAGLLQNSRDTGGSGATFQTFGNAGQFRAMGDGDAQNTNNSYSGLSDEKLKENISDASSQWDDIKAVRVRKYSLKDRNLDAADSIGVIAQELEASGMNGLVKEVEADVDSEDMVKSVKYSILYMKAIKALQEAMARIETLETKVAALEAE